MIWIVIAFYVLGLIPSWSKISRDETGAPWGDGWLTLIWPVYMLVSVGIFLASFVEVPPRRWRNRPSAKRKG